MNRNSAITSGCPEFRSLRRMSRRAILQAGAVGALGLGLPQLFGARQLQAAPAHVPRGSAKACIFLFMWGGPSQLETFDPKPDAPTEIRGEFGTRTTRTPGLLFSEHFARTAEVTDKLAVIRSLHHDDPAHLSSAHATLTGQLAPVVKSDATPPSSKDTPHLGSVVSRLFPAPPTLPSFVTMPWKAYHPAAPGGEAPGQHGGWLGADYDPLLITGDPNAPDWRVPALQLMDGLSPGRLDDRYRLLRELDQQRRALDLHAESSGVTAHQQQALALLGSAEVRDAFDLNQEPSAMRERYGRNIHGQCVLLARRLVEHGVPLVSVNWHNDGKNFWDTHGNNFNRLKQDLIPPADQALRTLLDDLSERGMLESTLVAWVGEFGRRPQISAGNAGREHWPHCYSGLLSGGGIQGGAVWGGSDKHAAYPATNPVSPQDYAATIMHAMGIAPDAMLKDRSGRPHRLYGGRPLTELL